MKRTALGVFAALFFSLIFNTPAASQISQASQELLAGYTGGWFGSGFMTAREWDSAYTSVMFSSRVIQKDSATYIYQYRVENKGRVAVTAQWQLLERVVYHCAPTILSLQPKEVRDTVFESSERPFETVPGSKADTAEVFTKSASANDILFARGRIGGVIPVTLKDKTCGA